AKDEIEEMEEKEIEEIIEEMEKEAVEEKEKKKKEKREKKKEEAKELEKRETSTLIPSSSLSVSQEEKREKEMPIIRTDISDIENQIINIIRDEPRRPRAITRMLRGKLNQNEVVSILRRLEEKNIVKREGTKSWKLA
ncbi:MAG: hypothetical protein QXV37_03535, partial [Candidatus Jordarchaeaceae archaeon]